SGPSARPVDSRPSAMARRRARVRCRQWWPWWPWTPAGEVFGLCPAGAMRRTVDDKQECAMWDGSELEVLDRQECLDLVARVPVGRLVFTEGALPAVHPVNFRLHDGHVIFRVAPGSKLTAAVSNNIVAFQVDQID